MVKNKEVTLVRENLQRQVYQRYASTGLIAGCYSPK